MHSAAWRSADAADKLASNARALTNGGAQTPSVSAYWLPKHVFLCISGNQVVLLDLKNDRYLAMDAARARPLAELVGGWPTHTAPAADSAASIDGSAIATAMIAKGLLTPDYALGKEATPVAIGLPSAMLLRSPAPFGEQDETPLAIRAHDVTAFITAVAMAAVKLRWRPLEHVVCGLTHRRIVQAISSDEFNIEVARKLVAIFRCLRPFAFTAKNACLFDSLALLEFLARYRCYPNWVFGVRTAPFAAHCWVQLGGTVFNDSVEHVSFYTPIMVI